MPEAKTYLSLREAADYAGVSVDTLRRRISDGSLRASRVGRGRLIRIERDSLQSMLRPIPSAKVG